MIAFVWLLLAGCAAAQDPPPPFHFRVVDAATGRGVPLVELETVHGVLFVTDSAGIAAIDEPGLEGEEVFFHVRSHGYRYRADGFGIRGVRAVLERGTSKTVEIERVNLAERLYRLTGAGIYRDSVMMGREVPIENPLLNGGVLGQDSVQNAVYGGKHYWFWGDTNRASYPLGNFEASGAVSDLPGSGGLDPSAGVDLRYFTGDDGFARPMCPIEGPGPVWIGGLTVLQHEGREVLLCHYARMKDLGTRLEQGIAQWNDERQIFEKRKELPLDTRLHPTGHPVRIGFDGDEWLCFPNPYPALRVQPRLDHVLEPGRYEAYTCLRPGARWNAEDPPLHRDGDGGLVWAWKADTDPVNPQQWQELVAAGHARSDEGWMNLADVETGKRVQAHGGSLFWNAHRGKWVMILLQVHGRSVLGEVWYAEAEEPMGPWDRARRIVTHDDYSFYNVKQHPYFDGEGGRYVYFEGTYSKMFSGAEEATPRYDYNQVMYRLDLADPRLHP